MRETREYKLPDEGNTLMVNEPQKNWGGRWTEEKLDAFEKYVKAYLRIMKKYATYSILMLSQEVEVVKLL